MDNLSTIVLEQADRLFQQHLTKDVLSAADRGEWPAALWTALEEAGLPLAFVPEEAGGVGLGASDVASLIRRSAFHAAPLPLAETMIANRLWADAGGDPLEGAASLAPVNVQDRLTLGSAGDVRTLSGAAHHVPWAYQATLLVLARDANDKAFLCRVRAGDAPRNAPRRNVAHEPRDTVQFDALTLAADDVQPAPQYLGSDGLMTFGAAIRAQQLVGGMERCLDYALTYANERVQFGRPIGKFQAIQHMLAVAAGQLAAATAAADALMETERLGDDAFAVAIAKARCGEAAGQVAAACHQVHGGMGFTQDHPLHFSTRRLWAWRDEWGAEPFWQERLGRLVCEAGADGFWPLISDKRGAMA